jgi:hypothetical protein
VAAAVETGLPVPGQNLFEVLVVIDDPGERICGTE